MRLKRRRRNGVPRALAASGSSDVPSYARQLPHVEEPIHVIAMAMAEASVAAAHDEWDKADQILGPAVREARQLQAAIGRVNPPLEALAMHWALYEAIELELQAVISMREACKQRDPDRFIAAQHVFGQGSEALGRHADLLNAWSDAVEAN